MQALLFLLAELLRLQDYDKFLEFASGPPPSRRIQARRHLGASALAGATTALLVGRAVGRKGTADWAFCERSTFAWSF